MKKKIFTLRGCGDMNPRDLKTKTLSILLTIVMLLGMLPMSAFAATTENNIITLTPDDLVEGASGEGWVFSNNQLTIQPEYTLVFEGECPVYVVNNGNIENGIFNGEVFSEGTISGGTFNERVNNNGTITGGTFNGIVANNTTYAVISNGIFNGEAHNFGTITGGTFCGKLVNYWDRSISGITIELSNALIEGGESYGWSLDDNNLSLNSGITFYWKAGETCGYRVENHGTISGGTFSSQVTNDGTITDGTFNGNVTNAGTITGGSFGCTVHNLGTISGGTFNREVFSERTINGGVFTSILGGYGIVTGTADLSELTSLYIRDDLRFGKDVKLPKAVIQGMLIYTGCDASTRITLEYYADGVYTSTHTVSGSDYSFAVEGYKRTNPEADLSTLEETTNEVKAASMDGYEISVNKANNTLIHVTVTHTAEYIYVSNGNGTHSRTCTDATHTHDDKTENCSGGIATCTKKAICTACGEEYGELAEHTYGTEWKSDGTNHWHECACGAKTGEAAHSGGTATCKNKAACSVCTAAYGELAAHTYKDGKCTLCEAADPNYKPPATNPQTADNSHMTLWLALLFISGGAVIALTVYDRKKRKNTI